LKNTLPKSELTNGALTNGELTNGEPVTLRLNRHGHGFEMVKLGGKKWSKRIIRAKKRRGKSLLFDVKPVLRGLKSLKMHQRPHARNVGQSGAYPGRNRIRLISEDQNRSDLKNAKQPDLFGLRRPAVLTDGLELFFYF
jgi:hypothetical protein